jgi:hypothetical protein
VVWGESGRCEFGNGRGVKEEGKDRSNWQVTKASHRFQ